MKKYINIKKFLLIVVILLLCFIAFPSRSKAAKNGFVMNNPAPRKYFSVDSNKLSDVTLSIVGSTTIKPENVKLYEVDSKGENPKSIQFSESITTNRKNHIYKLSHEKFLKGQTHYLYIKIKDDKDNIHESKFTIFVSTRKENGTDIKYYNVDDSPRLKGWIASDTKLYFNVKDLENVKSVKIQDMNNGNKEVLSFTDLENKDLITVDTNKFKSNKEIFNLKVVSKENDKNYSQSSIQTISFKLSHETTKIYPESIKLNKTSLNLDVINNKTATLKVTIEPSNSTQKSIKWTSSNSKVATVDGSGKVTAVSDGTTTITAKTENRITVKCTVTVETSGTAKPKSYSINLWKSAGFPYNTKGISCPRYYQGDSRWANMPYAGGNVANSGCGPCALAMIASGLKQKVILPSEIVTFFNSNGLAARGGESSYVATERFAQKYDLTYTKFFERDQKKINEYLDNGKILTFVIFRTQANQGIYTGNTHFLVCTGREGHKYYVTESSHFYQQDKAYTFNQVFAFDKSAIYVFGNKY